METGRHGGGEVRLSRRVTTLTTLPTQCHIIVIDDFVTTGQTLVAMQNLLVPLGKNCVFFAGINNNF